MNARDSVKSPILYKKVSTIYAVCVYNYRFFVPKMHDI